MEEVDPRWVDVEAGRRYTQTTILERYPKFDRHLFKTLPFEMAQKPKSLRDGKGGPRDIKTYLATDVDALVARLAAPPEPEPVDPRWLDVVEGRRYSRDSAMEKYPDLHPRFFTDKTLLFKIARKPKAGNPGVRDVKTFLAADVDALVARLAVPEPERVDPGWLDVEEGRRYTMATAMERYPQITLHSFKDKTLAFEKVRKPKTSKHAGARDVKTYLAADIDALAAERAKKRARHAPQEPEPEPEPEEEEEEDADECPICLDALGASATLVCGHAFHRACIDDWATTEATCPCCRVAIEITE